MEGVYWTKEGIILVEMSNRKNLTAHKMLDTTLMNSWGELFR